ncbi:hypothetical protein EVAR_19702_1 [Eumeta japonica]|uniref:Uncharacterized protein n=1 Tax=Eumeta variegata TaxID=151549 RepID=A0A4C1V2T3_EUMVA|nr:hypothetical protein EVAR_19702_1 [Eumeta japonica]
MRHVARAAVAARHRTASAVHSTLDTYVRVPTVVNDSRHWTSGTDLEARLDCEMERELPDVIGTMPNKVKSDIAA